MVAENYNENRLYTIACQLSRVVTSRGKETDYAVQLAEALKACYDLGVNLTITESLMLQAWKLTLLREFCNEVEDDKLSEYLTEYKVKPFVESLEKLGIIETVKKQLNYD